MATRLLSKRSSIPPWPGMHEPESFTLQYLFQRDSTRSPKTQPMLMISPSARQCTRLNCSHPRKCSPAAARIQKKIPLNTPHHDFLGEISEASLCAPGFWPKAVPKQYAQMSDTQMRMKKESSSQPLKYSPSITSIGESDIGRDRKSVV